MASIFGDMIVGHVIEAHGEKWFCIKQLCDDLESGHRLYLASKLDALLPAPTFVVGVEIEDAELERLRASKIKLAADVEAFRKRTKP